jgi:hypothetical protein
MDIINYNYKPQPKDIFEKYIIKNDDYILVEDPKHTKNNFHYTIWSIDAKLKDLLSINKDIIKKINNFLDEIKKKKIFTNEKIFITYPPTHNCLHLHIIPQNYVSHRPKDELYSWSEICNNYENIEKINNINTQKKNANLLELKFNIGLIIINNFDNIKIIKDIIKENSLHYIIAIRKKHPNVLMEDLIENYKFINVHMHTDQLHLYINMINYDFIFNI